MDDNNDAVIRERIVEYNRKTAAVADHYEKLNKVVMVKGEGGVDVPVVPLDEIAGGSGEDRSQARAHRPHLDYALSS